MKKIIYTLIALTLALTGAQNAKAFVPAQTAAKQAIVMDFKTGQILYDKNAHEKMPTSSMSKTMTLYEVFDALKKKQINLTDTFTVSEKAWKKGGSKMFVEVGKQVKVEDLIRGVAIQSGNDATIVLAEGLEGSEEGFAITITDKAHEIGMTDSNFANASGWPDPNHYSTAHNLAILGRSLIRDFPEYYHYFSEKEFTYNNIKQRNRNPLIYRDIGADGVKTGHTEIGGYGLIGSGINNGRRVVIVINGLESEKARAQESAKLLEWGLRSFRYEDVITKDQKLATVPVVFGSETEINITAPEAINLAVPKRPDAPPKITATFQQPLIAPIKQGDEIGTLTIEIEGQAPYKTPIKAPQDVAEKGWLGKTLEKIPYILGMKG